MRMTSKGQVTVPKAMRDKFGLEPGNEVRFQEHDGKLTLAAANGEETVEQRAARIKRVLEGLRGATDINHHSGDPMKAIRDNGDVPLS